jgi:hypothetical protein
MVSGMRVHPDWEWVVPGQGHGVNSDGPLHYVPVLPAIYLAKKNIQKQGALVDYEKVSPPAG